MALICRYRAIFLPVMVVTLPLPPQIGKYFPRPMVDFLQWFAFWTFAVLLTVPWLFCIYQLVVNNLGRTKRIKEILDEETAPKTVIVMPCYKEGMSCNIRFHCYVNRERSLMPLTLQTVHRARCSRYCNRLGCRLRLPAFVPPCLPILRWRPTGRAIPEDNREARCTSYAESLS